MNLSEKKYFVLYQFSIIQIKKTESMFLHISLRIYFFNQFFTLFYARKHLTKQDWWRGPIFSSLPFSSAHKQWLITEEATGGALWKKDVLKNFANSCEICEIFKETFFVEHLRTTAFFISQVGKQPTSEAHSKPC